MKIPIILQKQRKNFQKFNKELKIINPLHRKVKTNKFYNTQTISTMKASLKEEKFVKFSCDGTSKKIQKPNENINIMENILISDPVGDNIITMGDVNPGHRRNN